MDAPPRDDRFLTITSELLFELLCVAVRGSGRDDQIERMKAELVSVVNHELRTPLTSIMGYAELLDELGDPLTGDQRHAIAAIHRNAERLARLVDDLLVMDRLESGDEAPSRTPLDVDLLIAEQIDAIAGPARDAGVILAELEPSGAIVSGDAAHLARALGNLLSNAVKFTPAGGIVRVAADARAGQVAIVVSDTGIGIPADEQGSLFEDYFRASNAREACIPGTGLGLGLARRLIDAHDGSIAVESELDTGTTVSVTLPT
jgi:two-component system phosphate regulon sensor histidine kinase PhoR